METIIVIIWALWLVTVVCWIYIEKNTEKVWHEDFYPRDERGRIRGRKTREYYHRLKSGTVVPLEIVAYPCLLLLFAGFVLTGGFYMGN